MFDSMGAFTKQFTPIDGGYLYYPSKNGGGKLVTPDEYADLVDGWRNVAGSKGIWKSVGAVILAIVVWTVIGSFVTLPAWSDTLLTAACVGGMSAWLLRASLAPRRLVQGRPDIVPPRSRAQSRRQARALLNWRFIAFALIFSGVAFLGSLSSAERDFKLWAWLIGSGAMFALYIWLAIQKIRDR